MESRTEYLIWKRLESLKALRDVIMTLEGDYRVKFDSIPTETDLALLEFKVIKAEGKTFTLRDLTPATHPALMNPAETAVYDKLAAHYGHIANVSQAVDGDFVVALLGGQVDESFLADVGRKTGLLVVNHNHTIFTVRTPRATLDATRVIIGGMTLPTSEANACALRIASALLDAGRWNGSDYLTVYHPLSLHDFLYGAVPHPLSDLVFGEHYLIEDRHTLAPVTGSEPPLAIPFNPDEPTDDFMRAYPQPAQVDVQIAALEAEPDGPDEMSEADIDNWRKIAERLEVDANPTTLDDAIDAAAARMEAELDAALSSSDAQPDAAADSSDTAWATPAMQIALGILFSEHEFYPTEIHPTVALHHWLIESYGRKAFLRGRLEAAGVAVVNVSQEYMGDTPYSIATIFFDGKPDLRTAAPAADAVPSSEADRIADLRTCVALQTGLIEQLESRLADANAINQAQSNLIRDAILPTLDARPPRRVEFWTLKQSLNFPGDSSDSTLQRMVNEEGWSIAHEQYTTIKTLSDLDEPDIDYIRIVRLERDLPAPQPQPIAEAVPVADPLLSHAARNGGSAPAPRPRQPVVIEQARPLNPILNRLPIAQAIHRDGLEAWSQDRNADIGETILQDFADRQAARSSAVPANPFRSLSSGVTS